MVKTVPNVLPKHSAPYSIAFVGEAPGADEVENGVPFIGASGRLLTSLMAKAGIVRDNCFIGNLCQIRPPNNKLSSFRWDGPEIQDGLAALRADLDKVRPNLLVLLGAYPLKWAKTDLEEDEILTDSSNENDDEDEQEVKPNTKKKKDAITKWRGSLFHNGTYKCLPTIHPAACLRNYSHVPLLRFDLRRAADEGREPSLVLPQRDLIVNLTTEEILCRLEQIKLDKPIISIDIEGGIDSMSCISIATSAVESFIVPFSNIGPNENLLWHTLATVLSDPTIPKILQNSLYDLFVLQYSYHIPVRGVVDDTMLKHWELYCELPKSLAFQTSIYTREPYYKEEREAEDRDTFHTYCCKDSAVTFEINNVLSKQITKGSDSDKHYKLNLALLEPLLYMELKGISYDKEKAHTKLKEITHNTNRLQWALNEIAGCFSPQTKDDWFTLCRDAFCHKRLSGHCLGPKDLPTYSKTTSLHNSIAAADLLSKTTLSLADRGALAAMLGSTANYENRYLVNLNVESKTQMPKFLYETLSLPTQYKKIGGRLTDKPTTDVLALLTLWKKTSNPVLRLILTLRSLRTRSSTLSARTDQDGHIRCAYNIVGTTTGRLSCYESPTGSGFNLQTVTKKDRDLFLADDGYWLFQCDLSGADGWTVAAHCSQCGDPTMLEDYYQGLKPARLIALMYEGINISKLTRAELKDLSKKVDDDGWLYFACKRVQHGSNYGMGEKTMADQVLKDSYKWLGEPIYLEPSVCGHLQRLYIQRYPGLLLWHKRIKAQLSTHGFIISANGHKRMFFGRKEDHKTFNNACSDEPQNNTTYATNLALYNLWTDPENRTYGPQTNRPLADHQTPQVGMEPVLDFMQPWTPAGSSLQSSEEVKKEESNGTFHNSNSRMGCRLRIQPLHQIHDAVVGQFRKEETEWACNRIRKYFDNPLTIAGQQITIPFDGRYGRSWGELKEGKI